MYCMPYGVVMKLKKQGWYEKLDSRWGKGPTLQEIADATSEDELERLTREFEAVTENMVREAEATQLELKIQAAYLGPYKDANPMTRIHGVGPEGTACGQCRHLVGWTRARTYWKCSKRGDLTHGAKTDQRKGWQACGLFEEG